MCGRFVSTQSVDALSAYFGASFDAASAPAVEPNVNVAPTQDVLGVVADEHGERHLELFRWGLVPRWAKDTKIGSKMINARAETIAEKPAFRTDLRKHRLLIPMDGFYEWKAGSTDGPVTAKGAPVKQPMFIHRVDGEPLAVAGIWATWRDPALGEGPWLHTCTVITTAADSTMAPVHDRMPVILPRSSWDRWLDPTQQNVDELLTMLIPAPDDLLTMYPVSTLVNSVRNRGPELLARVDPSVPGAEG